MNVHVTTGRFTAILSRFRILVIAAALLFSVLSYLAAGRITVKTDVEDLLPSDNPQTKAYNEINDSFTTSNILVTIEGEDRDELSERAEELAGIIANDSILGPYISNITLGLDRDFLMRRLLWMADEDGYDDLEKVIRETGLSDMITAFNDTLEAAWLDDGGREAVTPVEEAELVALYNRTGRFAELMTRALDTADDETIREMAETFLLGERYMYSPLEDMLLFQITPNFSLTDRKSLTIVMERINGHLKTAMDKHPHLRYGAAGDIPQEADEEKAIGFDMLYPALAALVIILLLFYFSLHSLRPVLFSLFALGLGILFDIGIIGLAIGELNMITSSFGALLVGLGIDFGIHIISFYGDRIDEGYTPEKAISDTLAKTGKPVLAGGITTAIAFYSLCLSHTKGFIQFGFVAGTGILTVLASMFLILPALLLTFGRKTSQKKIRKAEYRFLGHWGRMMERIRPSWMIGIALLLTLAAIMLVPGLRFDYDLRRIGPQNTPAKYTEQRILDKLGISSFPSFLSVTSIEESRRFTGKLKNEKLVGRIESVSELIRSNADQVLRRERLAAFRRERHENTNSLYTNDERGLLADEIQRLEWNLVEIADITSATLGDDNKVLKVRDHMIREIRGADSGTPGKEVFQKVIESVNNAALEKLNGMNSIFSLHADAMIHTMTADRELLTVAELPEDIRRALVSPDGKSFLITVYPTGVLASREGMFEFEKAMHDVSPQITGVIQLGLELAREVLSETRSSGLVVLGVIALLLLLTFRSVIATLLALMNLSVAVILMMGVYSLIDYMNFINALAMPLIIGIGIDYSIHIIHHIRTGYGLEETMQRSGKAIVLSALTTMIGFGSLALLGTFRGIATLGILLFLGAGMSLLVSLTLLPVLAYRIYGKKMKSCPLKRTQNEREERRTIMFARSAYVFCLLAACSFFLSAQETAEEIIAKADEAGGNTTEVLEMEMEIYDRVSSAIPDSTVRLTSTGNAAGDSIMVFSYPRSINGLSILSTDAGEWIYFPSTGRVRKIGGSARSNSVQGVGGDFSYEDLSTGDLGKDYSFTLQQTLDDGWVLNGFSLRDDISYSKITIMIARADFLPRWVEYFRVGNDPVKKLVMHEIGTWDGVAMPSLMEMINLEKKSRTVVRIYNAKLNMPIDAGRFNPTRFYR